MDLYSGYCLPLVFLKGGRNGTRLANVGSVQTSNWLWSKFLLLKAKESIMEAPSSDLRRLFGSSMRLLAGGVRH
jgi:hypothetical protein